MRVIFLDAQQDYLVLLKAIFNREMGVDLLLIKMDVCPILSLVKS